MKSEEKDQNQVDRGKQNYVKRRSIMENKVFHRTEGDINLTEERGNWQVNFLSEKSKALLEEDSRYFIHQSLSTHVSIR